jgi:hypothetical protein
LDTKILDLIQNWWMTIDGNRHGVHILTEAILRLVYKNREIDQTIAPIRYVESLRRNPIGNDSADGLVAGVEDARSMPLIPKGYEPEDFQK